MRAKAEITQQELADKLGMSRQMYGMIETQPPPPKGGGLSLRLKPPEGAVGVNWIH